MKKKKSKAPKATLFFKTRKAEERAIRDLNEYWAAMARASEAFGIKQFANGSFRVRPWPETVRIALVDLQLRVNQQLAVGDLFDIAARANFDLSDRLEDLAGTAIYRLMTEKDGEASCSLVCVGDGFLDTWNKVRKAARAAKKKKKP